VTKKLPKTIFAAYLNYLGLHNSKPIACIRVADKWVSLDDDDLFFKKLGIDLTPDGIFFASPSEDQTKTWILGIKSVLYYLKRFARIEATNCDECGLECEFGEDRCLFCSFTKDNVTFCNDCGFVLNGQPCNNCEPEEVPDAV